MNKTATIQLARDAYAALEEIHGVPQALDYAIESERRHRGGDFKRYHQSAASVIDCARLVVASWVARYALAPERLPTLAEIVHIRPDVVQCTAVVAAHGPDKILEALHAAGLDPVAVDGLDYLDLIGRAGT